MEKYDINNFENESVNDWFYDLRQANDTTILEKALQDVLSLKGRLYKRECDLGVAAAEIIAAMIGHPALDIPFAVSDFIGRVNAKPDAGMIQMAVNVLDRIRTGSELQQIWDEREDGEAWRECLFDLEGRLDED